MGGPATGQSSAAPPGANSAHSATRREADSDEVVYLRTEDDLCLAVAMHGDLSPELYRRRDYLGARVFGTHFCELFSSADKESPADLWSCTFRLEQAVSVRALQELIMTQDVSAGTSRRVLLYGHAIRLRHLPSQKFMGCLETSSSSDKLAFDVGLADANTGEGTWWRIHPASKQRSEGEKVRAGDDIILVSISTERYLNTEGAELIQASFQQTFWRITPVCVGTARAAAVGHVNGCDVIRLFHRHVSQCLVARKDADVHNRHPMYEIGAVCKQGRSLWRVELLRMKFGHAFLGWGYPFRLRHVLSGKYLSVVDTESGIAELVAQPTLEQSVFCMLNSPDTEMVFEEKDITMGKPQIKFGDHVIYIRHMHTGLWVGHQSTKNRKRVHRHLVKTFQPVVMATEHHVDLGFTLTRAGSAELYATDVMHIALKELRYFRTTIQQQEATLANAKAVVTPPARVSPPNLTRGSSMASNASTSSTATSSSGLGTSLGSSAFDSAVRRPSPTRLANLQENSNQRPGATSPGSSAEDSFGQSVQESAKMLAAIEAAGGEDPRTVFRRRSASRKKMFQFRQQSSFSVMSGAASITSDLAGLRKKASAEISREAEAAMEATQMCCDRLKEIVEDLLTYFQWPIGEETVSSKYDQYQRVLRLLQLRQDLFQQQGLADLIVDTIELVGRHLNTMCSKSLSGRRSGFSLVMTNRVLLTLLGTIVRGNSKTCTTFAREKLQCLDWLAERLRDFYADGVLQVLHYLLEESSDALNMVKEKHIQALINLMDAKGRDPKVLEVLQSLCSCAGNVAVRKNQNTIADMLLPLRDLLLQTNHYKHIECVRPLVFVRSGRDDSAYHCWYCEVHVLSFDGCTDQSGDSYPLHLRVGWATRDGLQCWPGHASATGLEAVGGSLSSVGYDGRSMWCGGQECRVPTLPQRRRSRSATLLHSHNAFKTIDDTLKEKESPEAIHYRDLHTTHFKPGDKVGMCVDLHQGTVTFSLNGQLLDCHVSGFNPQFSAVFPVLSMDAGVRCSFHFGGKHGQFAHRPPKGYAPLDEAIVEARGLSVQRCVETGDLKHRELVGPPCLADHGAFIPNPIDTSHVILPSDLLACGEMIARHIHEAWSHAKIDSGWTFGERDDELKTNPCLSTFQDLSPTNREYDMRLVSHIMKTLLTLGYSIGVHSSHDFRPRYLSLNKKQYRQSNGYTPQPLDLESIEIPEQMSELIEALAQDTHNVWAAQRIAEGWSYGHGKCEEMKRTPFLTVFGRLPNEVKLSNRCTVIQTIKTILACGYSINEPSRKQSVGFKSLRRESVESAWRDCRTFRGQRDQAIAQGKWYYEVELHTSGFMRIGWCTVDLSVTSMPGSDQNAFVYDGFLACKWNNGSESFGRTWQEHDVIGCLLDLEKRTVSFSLNGSLLSDAMGNEVAFDNIPEGQRFLPVLCLGPAQRVTCLLGRDLGQLKMFNLCGLQQGYEPLCSMFNHFMPMWASCNMPVFVDISHNNPRLGAFNQPPAPNRSPYLRVTSKAVLAGTTPRMECVRLNLGIPLDGSVEMEKFCFDIRLSPGQDRAQTYLGWLSSEFRPEPGVLERHDSHKVTICQGTWQREETEGTESNNESGSEDDDDGFGVEMMECQSMHIARISSLLSNVDIGSDEVVEMTCVVDTEEGVITFRYKGEELSNHVLQIPSEPRLLHPVVLFVPTGEEVLEFDFSNQEDCLSLFEGILQVRRRFFVVPNRVRLESLEEAEWRMLPVNLPPIKSRNGTGKGGELDVSIEKPRTSVMVEISRELHSWSLPELVEMPNLMKFHTGTLDLYSGLCMQGNERVGNRITRDHVTKQQLMECAKMDDLPGPLNRSFFRLLSTLHLERHVNARLLTRSEFVIPLELVKKASKLYTASDTKTRFSTARSSMMGRVLPGMGLARRPDEGLCSRGSQSLCSSLTRASNQSCSIRHSLNNTSMDFDLPQLKLHVLDTLKQALSQHSYDNFRLTDQRQMDILVPLLSCCDQLLVMGLFDDTDVHHLLVLLDPSSFDDEGFSDYSEGLVSLPLHEDVKLQVCRLMQHLCDLQLRHRVEGIVSFADTFVSGLQRDQAKRIEDIKNCPAFSAALTAKMTKEFRMCPKEQMRVLLSFTESIDTTDSALKDPLKVELHEFHERLLSACYPEPCIEKPAAHVKSEASSADRGGTHYRDMLSKFVTVVRKRTASLSSDLPSPSPARQVDSLQRLICTTMLAWAQQSISSPLLVRDIFDLLFRQYNTYKEVMSALSKAYVVEGNGLGRIQELLEALGNVRSLLRVKMDTQEETLLCDALDKLRNNTMIYQHPDLMRLLGVHETVLAVMRNVLGEVDSTMFGTTAMSSSTIHDTHRRSNSTASEITKAACQSPATVAACCRFLTYFCRTSHNNQRAMFNHLGYLLNHSGTGIVSSTSHTPSGGNPLDVAAATIRSHHELALALKDWQLEHVVLLLASTVTGLTSSELLGQKTDIHGSLATSSELFASSDSFSMDDWKPNDGERYLNFLRQAVSINGQTVEENASVVVRLLIRRPECLGPGLDGEGQGLFSYIQEHLYYIDLSLIGCKHVCQQDETKSTEQRYPSPKTGIQIARRQTEGSVPPLEPAGPRDFDRVEMQNARLATEVLSYYSNLLDLLARCTDVDEDIESMPEKFERLGGEVPLAEDEVSAHMFNKVAYSGMAPAPTGMDAEPAPNVHRTQSQRRRAILQSLVSLSDLLGLLEGPFVVIEPRVDIMVCREDGKGCKVLREPTIEGMLPQHKASIVLFLQRVYGVADQKTLFAIVEKSILADLRVAATVGNSKWQSCSCALELNRYVCASVMPFLVRYVRLFRDSEHHHDVTLDTMLHTLCALTRSTTLSGQQRDAISDFLCKLIKQLRPSILQRLLRKLVLVIPRLTKTTDVALTVMHCHYDYCARYYGLASGWGAFGAASNEEKDLTMQLFMTLLNKMSSKSIRDCALYQKALECLCAICSAMAPDYLQPRHMVASDETKPGMPAYRSSTPSSAPTTPRLSFSLSDSMDDPLANLDANGDDYIPQPVDDSNIELTPDLQEWVEVFSSHCHDTWALRKFAHGYRYGAERNHDKKHHPLLRPYSQLSQADQDLSRHPCTTEVKAMLFWGWSVKKHDNVNLHTLQQRVRTIPRPVGKKLDYVPQPFDLSNIPLSKVLMTMSERLAENRYDAWALSKLKASKFKGSALRNQLLEFDMLPSKEKEVYRVLARETLKFLIMCGYRVERSATRLESLARQCSATSLIERRYSYVLFNKIIRRQEHILSMLADAGRLELRHFPATDTMCYVPIAPENRSTSAFPKDLSDRILSLGMLHMPLATHYFKCHHQYFMPQSSDRKRYGLCSREEKAQVGDFFFNLVLILQAQDSIFDTLTVDIVGCADTVVKAFDMMLMDEGKQFPSLKQHMVNFFTQAREDLGHSIINRSSGNRDGYVFTVLVPLLTFVFAHVRDHNFGSALITGDLLKETEVIIAQLYMIGTQLSDLDHSLQPVIGECLAAIANAMPMAFLEKSVDQIDAPTPSHLQDLCAGEVPVLETLLTEVEDALLVSREEACCRGEEEVDGEVSARVLSDSHNEVPHAITVVVPMLSSYMDRWWDKGMDGMCLIGKQTYPTVINTAIVDRVLTQAMEIIGNQFGVPNMDWICQAACDLTPMMRTCSVDLLKTMFLPMAKLLSQRVQGIFSVDQKYQRMRVGPKEEADISHDYNILARDTFAFFTLCSAFVSSHREPWANNPPLPKELVHFFLCLADVLHCWHFSLTFRREFQVCTAAIQQRFKGQRRYTMSTTSAQTPLGQGRGLNKRQSLFEIHSSLVAEKSDRKKVSGCQPFGLSGKSPLSTSSSLSSPSKHGSAPNSNVIVQCLNKLHPIIVQDLNALDSDLVQKGLSLMLRGAKEHEVADHVINVLRHHKKNKMGAPSHGRNERHSLGKHALSIVAMFKTKSEPDLDLRLQRIVNLIRVIYRLHNVDNPGRTSKHANRWKKLITRERKRTIIKCFLMIPLHKLPRHRAINHFLDVYRTEWLVPGEPKVLCLIDDVKAVTALQVRKKTTHAKRDYSSSEMSMMALEGTAYPTASNSSSQPVISVIRPREVDPLCQIIKHFCRAAKCNKQLFFSTQDSLFVAYSRILSSSCTAFSAEDKGSRSLQDFARDQDDVHRLIKQQEYLSTSGAAQMVVLVLMGCRGTPSPLVHQTLNLGIAMLTGGNTSVQKKMLEFLKGSTDSEFFASMAGLIESCCVLDMDTYERHNKAEDLGVGYIAGDRALHDANMTLALFRFLQLLCEGHYLDFQNYLRTQPGNTSTINIVFHTVDYLHRLQESVSDFFWHYVGRQTVDAQGRDNLSRAMCVAKQVFRTLTEYIQGPCVDNQLSLAKSRLWDAVGGFLHVFSKLQLKLSQDPTQLELLRELLELEKEMSITLLAMLEETNVMIADKMVETLMESVEHVEDIFRFFDMFLKLNDLATSQAFKEYDSNQDGWISNKEFEKAMDAQKMYSREEIAYLMKCADTNNDGRLDYMEFIERFHTHSSDIGFTFAVLLTNLSDHLPNDPRLAHFLTKGSGFLSHFEPYLGRVEIIGRNKKVDRVYFIIKKSTKTEWEKANIQYSLREFFHTVERGNQREKLAMFLEFCENTIFEMQHGCQLSNTEHAQRMERAESHMKNSHLLVTIPLSWTLSVMRRPVHYFTERCCDVLSHLKYIPFYVRRWLGIKPPKSGADTTDGPARPLPRQPHSALGQLITDALMPDQQPSNLAASATSTPSSPPIQAPGSDMQNPLTQATRTMKLSRLHPVVEHAEGGIDEPDTGHSGRHPSVEQQKPTLERQEGNIFNRYLPRDRSRQQAQGLQSSPLKRSRSPVPRREALDGLPLSQPESSGREGVRQRRQLLSPSHTTTLQPLPRNPSHELSVGAAGDNSPTRSPMQRLSDTLSGVADRVRSSFGGGSVCEAENAMPATAFSYIGTCNCTSSDIVPPAERVEGSESLTDPANMQSTGSRNLSRSPSQAASEAAGKTDAQEVSKKSESRKTKSTQSHTQQNMPAEPTSESYRPKIAIIQGNLLSWFGRSFTTTKMTALFLAFVINFLLLFFRVVHNTSKLDVDGDFEENGTGVPDIGHDVVGVEERHQYILGPLLFIFGIFHFLVSISALIGYGMLKVPLALFKREKQICKDLQFNGKWILSKPSAYSCDAWDALVISSPSFPRHYWDSYIKSTVRNKYAPQVGLERVCKILNTPQDDGNTKSGDASGIDLRYIVWATGVLLADKSCLYNLVWVMFSFLGNVSSYFFFSLHLLDVVGSISTLRTVLKSVTHNGRQLLMAFLMTCVVVYIYTVLAFNFFRKFYEKEVDGGSDPKCNNMLTCFAFHMYAGLRSGGGIGDSIKDPDGDEYEVARMVFDITFFFFVIIILLAIIQGLIIDSFGELRDREEEVKSDDETKCFICGIGKERFDVTPHGFQLHVEKEHNISNYLFLFMYLFTKDSTEHTGQESYILENLRAMKLDFFPVGAAFKFNSEDHSPSGSHCGSSAQTSSQGGSS